MSKSLFYSIAAVLVTFSGSSFAQTDQVLAVQDFTPGLNMGSLPDVAPPGTFTTLQNFVLLKPGRLQKRWGFTHATKPPLSAASSALSAMFLWDQGGSGTPKLITIDSSDSVRVTSDSTWSTMSTKLVSATYDFTPFNTVVTIVGDIDDPYTYPGSGTTLTALTNAPDSCHYVRNYKNYLWLGNESGNHSRVWFSNLGDQTTWGANDYIDIYPYDGDELTGLEVFGDGMVAFKERSTFIISGDAPTNFNVQKIIAGVGCHDYRSIQTVDGQLFWVATSGVYVMTQAGIENISGPLAPIFDETTTTSLTQTTVMASGILARHKQYWIALGVNSAVPNHLYVYHYDKKSWTEFTETFLGAGEDFDVRVLASGVSLGTQPTKPAVYAGLTSDARIYRYPYESTTGDLGPTASTVITSTATFAPLQGAMPHMMKRWNYLYMTAITTAADTISVSGINTTQTYTMSSGTNRFRIPLDTRSKALGVTITHATRAVVDLGNFLFTYTLQQFEQ